MRYIPESQYPTHHADALVVAEVIVIGLHAVVFKVCMYCLASVNSNKGENVRYPVRASVWRDSQLTSIGM